MSYKSAMANIGFGGGKSVIIADPAQKSQALFEKFGDFVDSLAGNYICAKDMNVDSPDLKIVNTHTKHVLGIDGVPGSGGDPSPVTARGLFRSLEATVEELNGNKKLQGLKIAVQGVGHVGYAYAEMIAKEGGQLIVSDTNPKALELAKSKLGAAVVEGDSIYSVACDIFSPCARGAILNEKTIAQLKCKAVVGGANNQLATEEDGNRIHRRGILYAPDYVVNSGGIINVFVEYEGYNLNKALQKADGIYATVKEIFKKSREEKKPTYIVADKIAEQRLYGGN
jgi:leucine dehydrogenase